jgi:hypothetical protein
VGKHNVDVSGRTDPKIRSRPLPKEKLMMTTATATFVAALIATSALVHAPAAANQRGIHTRDCVYDYAFMTEQECRTYRLKVLKAKSQGEQLRLRQDLHRVLDARAKDRGTAVMDWRGLELPPVDVGSTR